MIGGGEGILLGGVEDLQKKEKEEKGHLEGDLLRIVVGGALILEEDKDLLEVDREDHRQRHKEGHRPQDKGVEVLRLRGGHRIKVQDREEGLLEAHLGDHRLEEQELEAHWEDQERDPREVTGGDLRELDPELDLPPRGVEKYLLEE